MAAGKQFNHRRIMHRLAVLRDWNSTRKAGTVNYPSRSNGAAEAI
jgi:hypothetical protein